MEISSEVSWHHLLLTFYSLCLSCCLPDIQVYIPELENLIYCESQLTVEKRKAGKARYSIRAYNYPSFS